MAVLRNFQIKFKTQELSIYENEHWAWSLRPQQATLGSGILSLKRECATFGELRAEEFGGLDNIIKVIEKSIKGLFGYDVMNYLMLMMVDKHVHYHVIPRYEREIEAFGVKWDDKSWPGIPSLASDTLDFDKLMEISNYIKCNLQV